MSTKSQTAPSEVTAEIREALHTPSQENWRFITTVFQQCQEEGAEQDVLAAYILEHIQDWPDEARIWKNAELPTALLPLITDHEMDEAALAASRPSNQRGMLQPGPVVPAIVTPHAMSHASTFVSYQQDERTLVYFCLETGEEKTLAVPGESSNYTIYPDRAHILYRVNGGFRLADYEGNTIATVSVSPVPPSPYGGIAFEWDGWELFADGKHLLYAGYGESGKALLYLFDAYSLELLDTMQPCTSLIWNPVATSMEVLDSWGEGGAWFSRPTTPDHLGLFANAGDSFVFCNLYSVEDGRITQDMTMELERELSSCSDQVMYGISFLPQGQSLLVCDDLALFSVVSLRAEKRVLRYFAPIAAFLEGDEVHFEGYEESVDRYGLYTEGTPSCYGPYAFIAYEVNDYDGADFPENFFIALDAQTLESVGVIPEDILEVEGKGSVELGPNGWFYCHDGGETHFYRWGATPQASG